MYKALTGTQIKKPRVTDFTLGQSFVKKSCTLSMKRLLCENCPAVKPLSRKGTIFHHNKVWNGVKYISGPPVENS